VSGSSTDRTLSRLTQQVYLHPGQLFAAAHRCAITTASIWVKEI